MQMIPKIDWTKVTKREAETVIARAELRIAELKTEERNAVKAKLEKLAKDAGLVVTVKNGATAKRKRKMPNRTVRHPTDKTKKYGGYGPKPKWLKELNSA